MEPYAPEGTIGESEVSKRIQVHLQTEITIRLLRVFSTKTQDFTPMFLKPVVEVQLFLKGSESSKDKNLESPSFKHFCPETSVGEILKVLQIIFSNKLISEKNFQNFD